MNRIQLIGSVLPIGNQCYSQVTRIKVSPQINSIQFISLPLSLSLTSLFLLNLIIIETIQFSAALFFILHLSQVFVQLPRQEVQLICDIMTQIPRRPTGNCTVIVIIIIIIQSLHTLQIYNQYNFCPPI